MAGAHLWVDDDQHSNDLLRHHGLCGDDVVRGDINMKIIDCIQGSDEWKLARCGIVTASSLDKIISPVRLKPSASQDDYMARLLTEWVTGHPIEEDDKSQFVERGRALEPEARGAYAFETGQDVQVVGFITTDDGLVGCSPDALVGTDGGLELKCPALETHMKYLADPTRLVSEYRGQLQGNLYVTKRAWWDIYSYSTLVENVRVRVVRDEAYMAALEPELDLFLAKLVEQRAKFKARDVRKAGMVDAGVTGCYSEPEHPF